jgi:hypothetical protein
VIDKNLSDGSEPAEWEAVSRGEVPCVVPLHPGEEGRLGDVHLGCNLLLQLVGYVVIQQAHCRRVTTKIGNRVESIVLVIF